MLLCLLLLLAAAATTVHSDSRTGFHFQPAPHPTEYSVMNDPNGIFRDRSGLFHMFAQFRYTNASFTEARPSGVGWLHAVSLDALAWTHLPMALRPEAPWECGGIFTGSTTMVEGQPVLAYAVECNEAIGLALPANASDPLLVAWQKPSYDPAVRHVPDYNFRDPVTAFRPAKSGLPSALAAEWRMAVGCSGHLCTFRSTDFKSWRDAGVMYHVPGQHMWECPDVFPLGASGHWVIKASSAPFDEYVVGKLSPGVNDTFTPVAGASDIGAAIPAGQLIDCGNVYASKTFYDSIGKRQILLGWVHEEPGFPETQRWQGVQTIPRTVELDPRNESRLLFNPISEVASLRSPRPVATVRNYSLCAGCGLALTTDSEHRQDILLRLRLPVASAGAGVNVTLWLLANSAHTEGINITLAIPPQTRSTAPVNNNAVLAVNGTNTTMQWRTHPCAQGRSPGAPFVYCACYPSCGTRFTVHRDEQELTMRVLLDVSVIEVFAQGGRAVATKRAYRFRFNRDPRSHVADC